jgi:NAD(P)-dependent dehydrogenase (short-subunit alcohol dehydrogenase family)
MSKLNNKVVVVTGGSGLIGRALIEYLRTEKAIVVNAEIATPTDIENGFVACDITNEQSVQEAITVVLAKYNKIDGWVNCAYPRTEDWGKRFEDIPVASWKQNVDLQLNSVFVCCQLIAKQMQLQKSGSIINLSSIYGMIGPDFGVYKGTDMTMPAAYSAIKGGIINFTKYLASYLGLYNIRVNCVSPGGIFDGQQELFVKQYEERVPLRRMGTPKDIAPAIAFLLSDESAYITGHNLVVDGGWTAI